MSDDKPSTRLTSLLPSKIKGGLVSSKSKLQSNNSMPPPPQRSKLGLDRNHDSSSRTNTNTNTNHGSRNYRSRIDETPSHSGGVNREAERRVRGKERHRERRRDHRHHRNDRDSSEESSGSDEGGSRRSSRSKSSRKRSRNTSRSRSRSRDRNESGRGQRRDEGYTSSRRENDRERHDSNRRSERSHNSSSTRRDPDYDNREKRGNGRNRDDHYSRDTPSTQSSHSSHRNYSEQRRREDVAYAGTPLMHSASNQRSRMRDDQSSRSRGGHQSSSWENATPIMSRGRGLDNDDIARRSALTSVKAFPGGGTSATPMNRSTGKSGSMSVYKKIPEPDDEEFDREFYLGDDEEFVQDGKTNMGRFLYESAKTKLREQEMEQQRNGGGKLVVNPENTLRHAKRNALKDDQEAWENSRLLSSGAAVRGDVDLDFKLEEDTRITLLVHQVKPPFLGKGASAFSRIKHAVPTVKDNTSDFAKMAREGSDTLRRLRETKEKNTMRNKFWQIGGTKMGKAIGIKEAPVEQEDSNKDQANSTNAGAESNKVEKPEETVNGEIDYKKSSGFASHVNKNGVKSEAVSEFARKKTIRQQREYLPAFTVREDLLNVVRENNVIVVVGETGSG